MLRNARPSVRQSLLSVPSPCCRASHGSGRCVYVCEEAQSRVGKVQLDEEDTFQEVTWEESGGLSGGMFLRELGNLVIL